MPDFTAHPHPTLAVRCQICGKAPRLWCRHLNGQLAGDLHKARQAEADRLFMKRPMLSVRSSEVQPKRTDPGGPLRH